MRHVWGDYVVTLHIGRWLQLLLDLFWRVWKMVNVLWSSSANKSSDLCLGRKWLLRLIYWLGIKIPEWYWSWGVMWGRSNIAWLEVYNYLPNGVMVLRKTFSEPYLVLHWWLRSKNYWRWCINRQDLVMGGFLELKFPSFSVEGDEVKYFGKWILDLIEFYTSNEFG